MAQQKSVGSLPAPAFHEVAEQVGLRFQHYNGMTGKFYLPEIMGSGVALFDFDNDGDLDVYLVQGNILEPNTKPSRTLFPWSGSSRLKASYSATTERGDASAILHRQMLSAPARSAS